MPQRCLNTGSQSSISAVVVVLYLGISTLFEIGFHYVAWLAWNLLMYTRLTMNSLSSCS